MTLDITAAPGCYGIGLLYKVESNECKSCPFATTCGPLAAEQLTRLRLELGIVVKPKRAVKPGAPSVSPTGLTVPKKVQEHLDWIERTGIKITECLARGENPFAEGTKNFLRATCHLLLKMPHGITRDQLTMAFMSPKIGHSRGTAGAHVLQAIHILTSLGAADERNGTLQLRTPQ